MKITSELTGKEYKTVEECLRAEEEFKLQELKKEKDAKKETIKLNELAKTKKELAKAIEDADEKVSEANKLYEVAEQKVADILDKSNKEAQKVLDEAREKVKIAEEEKLNALMKFNKEFGTYKTVITGEKAAEEYKKAVDRFNNSFNSVFKDFLRILEAKSK